MIARLPEIDHSKMALIIFEAISLGCNRQLILSYKNFALR